MISPRVGCGGVTVGGAVVEIVATSCRISKIPIPVLLIASSSLLSNLITV